MRGEVLHYDETQGFGFITGVDGKQYTFRREDFRQTVAKGRGTMVEFQASAGLAKSIVAVQDAAVASAVQPSEMRASGRSESDITLLDPVPLNLPAGLPPIEKQPPPAAPPRQSVPSYVSYAPSAGTGVWDYFWRCLTASYVDFEGRARRKEFWGFVLASTLVFFALLCVGIAIDLSAWNFSWNDPTVIFSWALPGLWFLATILPGIAVSIRRQHDIGISGWLYLLVLIPSVGWLIILVFALIPSQKHDNKWGPCADRSYPAAVRNGLNDPHSD